MKKLTLFYALPILSGILIGTSYIPFPPWALLFCQVPLWLFYSKDITPRQAFWGGWLTQFILNAIGFHWIAYTTSEFGHLPMAVGYGVLIFFCAFAHLYYPFAGYAWKKLTTRDEYGPWHKLFLLITLFALFEWIYPTIFPWHLGYPWLWAKLPGFQFADWIGFEGLNVLTLIINGCLMMAYQQRREIKRALVPFTVAVLLFAIPNALGNWHAEPWKKTDAEVKVLAVQGNIGDFEKVFAETGRGYQYKILNTFTRLTDAGLKENPSVDFVLWPETAFPDNLDVEFQGRMLTSQLISYVRHINKPLLTGSYSADTRTKKVYNGFFLIDETGNAARPPYRKTVLLPFGEYFPGAEYAPFLLKLFPEVSSFGRGNGPTVLNYKDMKIGQQICYEGLFADFSASLARNGADWFVNINNDSWFGKTFEPYQNGYMTLARGVEFRRPLVRSTNTGITSAILADGTVLEQSPIGKEWTHLFVMPYRRSAPVTFYEKIVGATTSLLAIMAILLVTYARERSKRTRLARNSKTT